MRGIKWFVVVALAMSVLVLPARAADVTAADMAAPRPAKGQNQFSGLYVQQQLLFFGRNMSIEYHLFYFFPDGRCFLGTPPGGTVVDQPGDAQWQELAKADPKNCATYLQTGDTITFQRAGKPAETKKFSFEKPGDPGTLMIDTLGAVKREGFKEGATMTAKYEGGFTLSSAQNSPADRFLAVSGSFDFKPDGTFTKENAAAYDSQKKDNTAGNSASTIKTNQGKYKLAGHTIEMTLDGQTAKYTVFTMPEKDENPPLMSYMNGTMYELVK